MAPPASRGRPAGRARRTPCPPSRLLTALLWIVWVAWAAAPLHAASGPPYKGRLLAEVLNELKERGLELIFSSAVVAPDLRVTVEPRRSDPRGLLEEILGALGLEAREGPAGSLLIVAGKPLHATLRGRVRSAARGAPVPEAIVRLTELSLVTVTEPDGSFKFEGVAAGSYDLLIEALGFQLTTLAGVRVPVEDDAGITVWLREQPGFVTELVVTPSHLSVVEQELGVQRSLGQEDAVLMPSFGGDISRIVEYLPGVAAPDNSAALHVRGSASGDVSFVLDGLELYDPFHLQSFQSPFSLIDSHIVDRVDFSGGGFTAEFGDRHGGRLEIRTLLPDHPPRGEVELGTLNSRVSYRSPLESGAGSWLLAIRGWYPEAHQDTIELGGGERVDPRFGDIYAKSSLNISSRSVLSAHVLGAYDYLEFDEGPDEDGPGERASALTRNGYFWLNMLTTWTPALTTETMVSLGTIDRVRDGRSAPDDEGFLVEDSRNVLFGGLRHSASWQLGGAHLLKAGLDVRVLRARYRYQTEEEDDPNSFELIELEPDGGSYAVWLAHRMQVARGFTTEVGIRLDRQDYTDVSQVSPRFNAVWRPHERTELRIGIGRYTQSQRIHELRLEDGETRFHRAEESYQTEMSWQHGFPGGLRLRLDAYSRLLTRVNPRFENLYKPVELFPETGEDRIRIAPTRARLRGIELLLHGNVESPFTWWVSYALSSAEDEIDSEEIPRRWDQTHTGRFLTGYRWGDGWMIALSGTAHTGWPTTPITATATPLPGGGVQINEVLGEINSDRFDTYIRLDAKARRTFTLPGSRLSVTAEVINLTDRDNACCVDEFRFEPRPGGSVDVDRTFDHWRTITPTFSLLWEF